MSSVHFSDSASNVKHEPKVEEPELDKRKNLDENQNDNEKENKNIKMVEGKNTVDFKPRYDPPDLRLVPAPHHWKQYKRPYSDQYFFYFMRPKKIIYIININII